MATKKEPKPIGVVTHYFGGISVAIVKFNKAVDVGTKVHFRGATTDFEETIKSMQFNHEDIKTAKKNQEVGIKVGDKVREGDEVYAVEE
ncbi:MAG: translation elongation factor-like protein [Patescibacteria group bacterium]|nr:translation elongation factor-like protein [Patescibacteria group bacterium]